MRRKKSGQFARKGGPKRRRKRSAKKRAVALAKPRGKGGQFVKDAGKKTKRPKKLTLAEALSILKKQGYRI